MDWEIVIRILLVTAALPGGLSDSQWRNFDPRYTSRNVPEWKQRACEKQQKNNPNARYICDEKGDVKCLPGWQGDLCQVPICRRGCDPMNGYCQRPGECRCHIGYTGDLCDKCIPLPGCQHGTCSKPFECVCKPGWDGLFCTEPTCRQGCHSTRGYCEAPGECRCRIGWAGPTCADCATMPGCQHGNCTKPLECNCLPGYTGLLCQTPLCSPDCSKQHGYCRKPGECRCKVGWTGPRCDKCFPYPGCENGYCERPWECICKAGWGGMLCDEKLTYCAEHPSICENGGECEALTKEDGNYRCRCKQGYLGKNCEIVDEFMLTSTAAPRITPPPLPVRFEEEQENRRKDDILIEPTASASVENLTLPKVNASGSVEVGKFRERPYIPLTFPTLTTPAAITTNPTATAKTTTTTTTSSSTTTKEQSARPAPNSSITLTEPVKTPSTATSAATFPLLNASTERIMTETKPVGDRETTVGARPLRFPSAAPAGSSPNKDADEEEDDDDEDEDDDGEEDSDDGDDEDDEDEDDEEDEDDQFIPNVFENETRK